MCIIYRDDWFGAYDYKREKHTLYVWTKGIIVKCLEVGEEMNTYLVSITLSKDVEEDSSWKKFYV